MVIWTRLAVKNWFGRRKRNKKMIRNGMYVLYSNTNHYGIIFFITLFLCVSVLSFLLPFVLLSGVLWVSTWKKIQLLRHGWNMSWSLLTISTWMYAYVWAICWRKIGLSAIQSVIIIRKLSSSPMPCTGT